MDLSGIAGLAGGVGGGGAGGGVSTSATATSGNKGEFTFGGADLGKSGSGARAFVNNVAFPGATQSVDAGINAPVPALKKTWLYILAGIGGLVVLLLALKKFA